MADLLSLFVGIIICVCCGLCTFEGISFAYHLDLRDCMTIDGLPEMPLSLGFTDLHTPDNFVFAE